MSVSNIGKLMKKIMLAMVCVLAIAGCKQKQGQTEGGADIDSLLADSLRADSLMRQPANLSPEDIEVDWANKEIPVAKGGKKPDIITLVQAFNKVWNVEVVEEVLRLAADPKFTRQVDEEYDSETIVDRKNGYMCVDSGGTDGDYMEACVWRRDNGHRLFAIRMGGPTDPEIEVICFYDYDPATETLTPEASPVDTFTPVSEFYNYQLPHQGKDFIINEYLLDEEDVTLQHIYTWDGQKLVYAKDRKVKP